MSTYLNTYTLAKNEIVKKSLFDSPLSDIGLAYELIETAKNSEWTQRGAYIADILLAEWTNGLQANAMPILLAIHEAYNAGVIDGKRAERAKRAKKNGARP